MSNYDSTMYEVAIVGISGRFPKAKNMEEFWKNLVKGEECITFFSDEELLEVGITVSNLGDEIYVKARPYIEDIEYFDGEYFNINGRDASLMDPQHRLILECALEAMEDSGYNPYSFPGNIGVFLACDTNTYVLNNVILNDPSIIQNDPLQLKMSDKDYLCTRVSYSLNLTGPSVMVQSACSSSLAAVHYAMESILGGECEMALVGAVSLTLPNKMGYYYKVGGVVSKDGHCRCFDKESSGTVYGDGAGVVILKRLSEAIKDGDNIYSVIKGMALNNDGASRIGFTAPSLQGQTNVIKNAMEMADVTGEEIDYIETPGTGTALGDSIEIAALTDAYAPYKLASGVCPIGSIKPNIGHSSTASGIASLIKVALCLKYEKIVPTINYTKENPNINFENSPFYVNTILKEWKRGGKARLAGISAFGLGGSNAHLIMQEAPIRAEHFCIKQSVPIMLSAKSELALNKIEHNLLYHLLEHKELLLRDIAGTLNKGRHLFPYRSTIIADSVENLCISLDKKDDNYKTEKVKRKKSIIFMFSGVGEEYLGIAKELFEQVPLYKKYIEECNIIIQEKYNWNMNDYLFGKNDISNYQKDKLQKAEYTSKTSVGRKKVNKGINLSVEFTYLVVFTLEYAMAKFLMSSGVIPDKFIGYSIGEYVAAYLSGVFSLEDVIHLLYKRGSLISKLAEGKMLSIMLSEKEVEKYLNNKLSIAAVETPRICVVAGENQAIQALELQLSENSIAYKYVPTNHAFHSRMMEPIVEEYKVIVKQVAKNLPTIPFISNITGTYITDEQVLSDDYWGRHIISTIKFSQGIQKLLEADSIFIEVGAGNSLYSFVLQHSRDLRNKVIQTMGTYYNNKFEIKRLLIALAKISNLGCDIKWDTIIEEDKFNKISLPTYPFERKKFWLEPMFSNLTKLLKGDTSLEFTSELENINQPILNRENLTGDFLPPVTKLQKEVLNIWINTLGFKGIGIKDDFFEIGGNSLLAVNIVFQIRKNYKIDMPLDIFIQDPTILFIASYLDMFEWHHSDDISAKKDENNWLEIII